MYTDEEINIIVLSSFDMLTYGAKRRLLHGFSTAEPDFDGCENFLIKTLPHGVYNIVKGKFSDAYYRRQVVNELDKKGITCVTYFSGNYPEALKHISDPPLLLYCKGDISLLNAKCFSIVGSRRTNPASIAFCKKLSGELSTAFTIVTGLAEGADAAAAEGALENSGKVISVLANGLDVVYPACNAQLLKKIQAEGLVITEYTPETKAVRYNFPVRNRIIAGLSKGTLVVSAGAKSGALITADHALEYGRDVFAIPYSPQFKAGEGCNSLIKNGAYLTDCADDIFNCYGLNFRQPKVALSDEERELYEAVKAEGEAFIPKLAEKSGKQPFELMPVISSLEIKGMVARLGGNRYSAL